MWLLAEYSPVTLFSLRTSTATSSGGRTNLCPTMYAVKLALVSAALEGGDDGRQVFELIKPLAVRFKPARRAVVNNCFIRIQRQPHDRTEIGFQPTVAYREFVYLSGEFTVAIDVHGLTEADVALIESLLARVNYLGKRGGLIQLRRITTRPELDDGFGYVLGDQRAELSPDLTVQFLDDFGPDVTFDAINTYSDRPARLGRDRIIVPVALPYRRVGSSRSYTYYERVPS